MIIVLLETAGKNLIFGFMPENIGLFVFGVLLIVLAVGMRWFFDRKED
ncbi:hypothetical protein BH20ACI1_BH20ACI1_20820 [soil metagenome]